MSNQRLAPATLAAQGLGMIEPVTKAVVQPIHVSTTFERDADNQYSAGRCYSRADNPTFDQVEATLAALEQGTDALVFASGMAAATACFQALGPGDHVIAPTVMYWALRNWLTTFASRWGLKVSLVDTTNLDELRAAIRPNKTKLIWLETPSNPLWHVTDIAAVADIAHQAGAKLAVDSTVAATVFTQPLTLGADLVMHAATKYLNGHSDLVAGALIAGPTLCESGHLLAVDRPPTSGLSTTNCSDVGVRPTDLFARLAAEPDGYWKRIRTIRSQVGGVLGSFEAWLLMRGLRTLHPRVRWAAASAQILAERLAEHPAIAEVLYPGLPSFAGYEVACRQMRGGFGAMLSIRVNGGELAAIATAAKVQLWKRATSLGGVESLLEHRASIEGLGSPCPTDLLRLSVGVEDAGDLFADLDQALRASVK
ncbi:MAG: PLP-dependent transferase [Planctomycetota bacterium]|nr:MAG: PLP-dependent transferase [Planctomycetota bacterium]